MKDKRSKLTLSKEQTALMMMMNVFKNQMTDAVVKQYQDNNILTLNVLRNMSQYYQPKILS